ncbi:MAG: PIN domain-containing protein [Saprospiraceae bacterium]|nr:PIN domain-containing protein [Saprospiraceae bacterium]MBK8081358.1 PIN domain-containing protein [Saprospiraceae bacterium]MBK8855429.1 PIN domain-containing protein [Saprospiraceae bacterium]MBK9043724.1 PIN domain-containing protein [Saprospiraceae bacterium]
MKKLFLDANVLVAVLNKEYPLFTHAARILSLAGKPGIQLYTSPVCLSIAFYFAEKKSGNTKAREKIQLLSTYISVCAMNHEMVEKTLQNRRIHDFEDGLEYYAAVNAGCNYIITENMEDFYFSEIEVKDCSDFLSLYAHR